MNYDSHYFTCNVAITRLQIRAFIRGGARDAWAPSLFEDLPIKFKKGANLEKNDKFLSLGWSVAPLFSFEIIPEALLQVDF